MLYSMDMNLLNKRKKGRPNRTVAVKDGLKVVESVEEDTMNQERCKRTIF